MKYHLNKNMKRYLKKKKMKLEIKFSMNFSMSIWNKEKMFFKTKIKAVMKMNSITCRK